MKSLMQWRTSTTLWGRSLVVLAGTALVAACSTVNTEKSTLVTKPLATPEAYSEWKQRFESLDRKVIDTREQYAHEHSMATLQAYERAVRDSLDHGFGLIRAYPPDQQTPSDSETIALVIPFLNTMANQLMDIAEEYVKQHRRSAGTAIASELITHYTDLPLLSAQLRAQTLLFQYRQREDF